jgi:hypothetical protein
MLHGIIFAVHPHVHHFFCVTTIREKPSAGGRLYIRTRSAFISGAPPCSCHLLPGMHKYNTNIMLPGTEGSTGHNESNQNLKGTAREAIVDVLRTLIHRI